MTLFPIRAALLALVLCGPLGWPGAARAQQESPGITDRMKSFFGLGPSTPQPGAGAPASGGPPQEIECPDIAIRQGASTLAISSGTDTSPMSMRYQVTIGQTARECAALGAVMTLKVGVQGRVLLGPAGGPGKVDVPLRVAVVEEGTTPKPIVSKLYRITVDVPPGQTMVPFTHVDQDVTFPMPRGDALDNYVVYVGFDPGAGPAKPERKKKK
jgi:hypothetical protein